MIRIGIRMEVPIIGGRYCVVVVTFVVSYFANLIHSTSVTSITIRKLPHKFEMNQDS